MLLLPILTKIQIPQQDNGKDGSEGKTRKKR